MLDRMGHQRRNLLASVVVATVALAAWGVARSQSGNGFIQIVAEPGIQVFVDGNLSGTTSSQVDGLLLQDVPAGTHTLLFVKRGFVAQTARVQLAAGQVLVYNVEPFTAKMEVTQQGEQKRTQLNREVGTVVIQTLPVGASVKIASSNQETDLKKTKDVLTLRNVPSGRYTISATALGKNVQKDVGICPNDTVRLFLNFAASPVKVQLTSRQLWPECLQGNPPTQTPSSSPPTSQGTGSGAPGIAAKPRLGVSVVAVSDFPAAVRKELDMPDYGVVVMTVAPGGPGQHAGLVGPSHQATVNGQTYPAGEDILLEADGARLTSTRDIQELVLSKHAGDSVHLLVWNRGETRSVTVRLQVVPQ